jgi:tetratricopeptide (TPR) repeat protein
LRASASLNFAPVHYGTFLLSHMRYAEARDMLLGAVERDPLSAHLLFVLAFAYDGTREHQLALATLDRATAVDPGNPVNAWGRALIHYWSLGAIENALPVLAEARRIDPRDPEIPALSALAWLDLADPVRAAAEANAATRLDPSQPLTRRAAVAVALFQGDIESAAALANVAVERKLPSRFESRLAFLRSLRLQRNADLARVQQRYEQSYPGLASGQPVLKRNGTWIVSMPREYALAEVDLAAILIERRQHDRAKALLDDAWTFVERSPPTGMFGYGTMAASIHALRGDPARAIDALRVAIRNGWIENSWWVLKYDPSLTSLRKTKEFKEIVASLEARTSDMRARLIGKETHVP